VSAFIPASPRDLTPQWVTDAMRAAGALPAGRVVDLEVTSLTDGGTGFTGDTVRVRLSAEGGDHDVPETVIAKFPTVDHQTRGMLEQFDAYAREIRFYRHFAHRMPCRLAAFLGADFDEKGARRTGPVMSKLVDVLPDRLQLAITADVTKFMRATTRRYALLIEDLGADTIVYDMAAPPSSDQLAAALEVLATVHAAFWGDESIIGDAAFRPIVTTTPGLYQTVGRKRCLTLAKTRWEEWLTPDHLALVNDSLDRFPSDVARLNQPITMIHGDPRSDNILYRSDGQVVLIDWALVGYANPAFDVGYLLSSSLLTDQMHLRPALVEGYEAALAAHGVEFDGAELRDGIDSTYRALAVQQLMSIPVLNNESYGPDAMYDLWFPRILAGLDAGW
jgi:hypothetical protein